MSDRQKNGRFSEGNRFGHGRPRRATERSYLAALAESVSVEEWRQIVERAKADALAGDAKARDWLSRYLLGATPPTLTEVAATESVGIPLELAVKIVTADFPITVDPSGYVEYGERIVR